MAACSKRRVTEEDLEKDELKKSRVDGSKVEAAEGHVAGKEGGNEAEPQASKSEEAKTEVEKETEDNPEVKELILGETFYQYSERHINLMLHVFKGKWEFNRILEFSFSSLRRDNRFRLNVGQYQRPSTSFPALRLISLISLCAD